MIDKLEILRAASLDLSYNNYSNILTLLKGLGLSNMVSFKIPRGTKIFRLRPSLDEEFTNEREITYKATTRSFGRAHKPGNPMFYGSIQFPGALNPVATNIHEILHILKNGGHNKNLDIINLTIGCWKVNDPMAVIPMVFLPDQIKRHEILRPLVSHFGTSKERNSRNSLIMRFIANEFAKSNIKTALDYQISAAFSEMVINAYSDHIESIMYPSVRTNGDGINICITPKFTKNYLKLESVSTINLYGRGKLRIPDYEKRTDLIMPDGSFKLENITDSSISRGKEWCLKELSKASNSS